MVRQTSIKDKHHGEEFNVFAYSKLLNNVDTLNGILKEDADIECISDTITAFIAFKGVKDACFGQDFDPALSHSLET